MERCKYELFVEDYFGFNTDEVINEKTKITTDFGQLVNLLAMFDNERGADDASHESSGLNKPDVIKSVCGNKNCDKPSYEFGLCFDHFCENEQQTVL